LEISSGQLNAQLRPPNRALYWVSGDDPLLMLEAGDAIRSFLRKQGFEQRDLFHVDKNFDWNNFFQLTSSLSLFAEKRVIELRFASAKPDEEGKKALQHFIDNPSADIAVMIIGPKLDKATTSTKWFGNLTANALLVKVWPLKREELPNWLNTRLKAAGISASRDAVAMLADRVEGNLLAAVQDIERIKLAYADNNGTAKQLEASDIAEFVSDNSRLTSFDLIDATLLGETSRAQKILQGLRAEGVHPLPILATFTRELDSLLPMLAQKEQGQTSEVIMRNARVWSNRKTAVKSSLARLSKSEAWQLLHHARLIDGAIKGMNLANPWDELSLLSLRLSGASPTSKRR
jgi:DNA polymerase-3 subunit delta